MTGLTLDNIPHAANSSVSNESCNEQSDHSSEDKTLVEEDGEAAQSRRKRLAMFGPVSGSRNMQLFESLPRRNEFLLSGYTPPTPKPVNRVLSTTGFNHVSMDINESDNKARGLILPKHFFVEWLLSPCLRKTNPFSFVNHGAPTKT